jgi:hypothetical protein
VCTEVEDEENKNMPFKRKPVATVILVTIANANLGSCRCM